MTMEKGFPKLDPSFHACGLRLRAELLLPVAREANTFAAQLIMPEWLVRVAADRIGSKVEPTGEGFYRVGSARSLYSIALYRQ